MPSRIPIPTERRSRGRGRGRLPLRSLAGALLALLAALLLGSGPEHGPTARLTHRSLAVAVPPTVGSLEGSGCGATERCAPDPDDAAADLDCPPTACAVVLPRPGEPEARRAGVQHRPEWPGPGPVTSRGGPRPERPPRAA